ncbi:ubiquitin-conjugating enzyme E2 variant [Rhodotorula toruloides]|uniref:Ubiquitin-conjugating enzyme E2 variant n=1 Tax=Rhodotorula toruloides TaxID=5286 RepID=A0A511KSD3_RHOTO|nr:ubiquitin-conjugating enzyme E2 variant [Rhodotorula toruloides]
MAKDRPREPHLLALDPLRPQYPDVPPEITFLTRINLPCVDPTSGKVSPNKLGVLANWKHQYTLETVLVELRRDMATPQNRKLAQPAEGATF